METKDIQKLIDFIAQSTLDEVNIETSELKLSVKRHHANLAAPVNYQQVVAVPQPVALPQASPSQPIQAATIPAVELAVPASNLVTIKSPMIGTFYLSAGPDKPSFVEVGDEVSEGKIVCIIEAMKLFNEIESEISGKIVKILVANATPVEFDQPLFLVEPN